MNQPLTARATTARSQAIALVTTRAAHSLDEDMPPLEVAFAAAGAATVIVDWDDPQVAWAAFDGVLLRSAWDYAERRDEFLAWAERVAARTRLLNPLPIVRWSTDKHYLGELAAQDVPTVPGEFAEPGSDAAAAVAAFFTRHDPREVVVKPAIGAGSRDAQRHEARQRDAIVTHVARLLAQGRSVLVQPYLASVDEAGETALVYFEGQYSHAFRKGPLLRTGAAATAGLFAPEEITPRQPGGDEREVGARAVAAIPGGAPLYARVDLIRDAAGAPRLLELELAEPSLYFAHAPGSAARFAALVLAHVAR